eukprot:1616678-Prorocentrum_lima.AAC.1
MQTSCCHRPTWSRAEVMRVARTVHARIPLWLRSLFAAHNVPRHIIAPLRKQQVTLQDIEDNFE